MALNVRGFENLSSLPGGRDQFLMMIQRSTSGRLYKMTVENFLNNHIGIQKVGDAITIGDVNDTTTVLGNIVLGTDATNTVTFNARVVNFSGAQALIFEGTGADDASETTISVANPAADRIYTFPDVGIDSNIALNTSTIQQLLTTSQAAANAIRLQASNAAGGIDIDAGTGGIAIDSTGVISLGAAANSDFTTTGAFSLTLSSTAGSVLVSGGAANNTAIDLATSNGGIRGLASGVGAAGDIGFTSTAGSIILSGGETVADAIRLLTTGAGGGFDIDTANGLGGNGGAIDIRTGNAIDVNNNGGNVLFTLGSGFGAGNGGSFTITGSAGGATGTGSAIGFTGGASAGAGGTAGSVTIDAGAAALGTLGTMSLGTVNAGQINISRAGQTTAIGGVLTLGTDLAVTEGGTGVSTLADGGLVIGNATGAVEVVAAGLTTQILVGGGALTAPVWGTDIPTAVTIGGSYVYRTGGTDIIVADGGTGVSTLADGGLVIGNAAGAVEVVAAGLTTQILVGGGALTAPVWGTDIPTAVTIGAAYVYRAGGTDVAILDGGTGASLAAVNGGIVYSGAAVMAISAAGTALQALVSGGAGAPTWSAITLDGTVANVQTYRNGTSLLDVAAGISVDFNANLTVNSAATLAAYANTVLNNVDEAAFKAATNLEAGTDFHAYTANGNTILTDAGLLNIAGVATVADRFLTTTGVDTFAAQAITASGIALVGRTVAIDQIHYGTGAGTYAETPLTAAGRSILDDASVGAIRTTLGVGTADNPTFAGVTLTAILDSDVSGAAFRFTSTENSVTAQVGVFEGTKGAGAALDNDEIFLSFFMKNDAAAQLEFARLYIVATDVNAGTSEDSEMSFAVRTAGALAKELNLSGASLYPSTDDGLILGSATNRFSDLFLALGAIINFDNGDVTITHAANSLTVAGGTFNATGGGALTGTWSDLGSVTTVDINGGAIDGAIIGAAVAAAGTFTTCDATTDFTVGSLVITSNVITATGRLTTAMTTPTVGTGFDGAQTALWAIKGRIGASGPVISEFIVDLTSLINSTTTDDIIGDAALAANCHFGQVTAAIQGTIQAIEIVCLETPAGGDPDIDFYSAVESTGTENDLITGLTETLLLARGASWANGDVRGTTAVPAANEYLYLAVGSAGGAPGTYTAGKFKVTIYGTV